MSEGLSNGSFVENASGLQPLGALVMERQVAKAIQERLTGDAQQLLDSAAVDLVIAAVQADDGISLNREQHHAIHLAWLA